MEFGLVCNLEQNRIRRSSLWPDKMW